MTRIATSLVANPPAQPTGPSLLSALAAPFTYAADGFYRGVVGGPVVVLVAMASDPDRPIRTAFLNTMASAVAGVMLGAEGFGIGANILAVRLGCVSTPAEPQNETRANSSNVA